MDYRSQGKKPVIQTQTTSYKITLGLPKVTLILQYVSLVSQPTLALNLRLGFQVAPVTIGNNNNNKNRLHLSLPNAKEARLIRMCCKTRGCLLKFNKRQRDWMPP